MSLVLSSNICFLPDVIVSILAGSVRGNLSNCRCSFIGKTFLCFKVLGSEVQRFTGSEVPVLCRMNSRASKILGPNRVRQAELEVQVRNL